MPAPAVIPAPIAYINAAAVKGFVVEFRVARFCYFGSSSSQLCHRRGRSLRKWTFTGSRMLLIEEVNITHATHVFDRPSLSL